MIKLLSTHYIHDTLYAITQRCTKDHCFFPFLLASPCIESLKWALVWLRTADPFTTTSLSILVQSVLSLCDCWWNLRALPHLSCGTGFWEVEGTLKFPLLKIKTTAQLDLMLYQLFPLSSHWWESRNPQMYLCVCLHFFLKHHM